VPRVVAETGRGTVGQNSHPAADVKHVLDVAGHELDRQEVAVVVAAAVEHQRVVLRCLHLSINKRDTQSCHHAVTYVLVTLQIVQHCAKAGC